MAESKVRRRDQDVKKAERLLRIEAILLAHPEGMTQADLARKVGCHRSTISRYMPELTTRFAVQGGDDIEKRLWIDREHYLVNVQFKLHEAMAMHLATRLMATRSDKHNPHAAAALRKLGLSLERLTERFSNHLKLSADVMDDPSQRQDPRYLEILEKLTLAWAEGRCVKVWHRHEATRRVLEYHFEPYFVEPYAVGQTTHVIGRRTPPGDMRTFKIERIERIELLAERFTIPDDFDAGALLSDAWGIWYSDEVPVEVVLRFHPRVAARVRETRWHRSETVEKQSDNFLLWRAHIAEPQEMVPWIRGWGSDVEVVAPTELRSQLVGEVRATARIYGLDLDTQGDVFDDFFGG